MFKCSKHVLATAVLMAVGGFAIADDNQGTSGPGKSTGNPVSDRGTDGNQNPAGGQRASDGSMQDRSKTGMMSGDSTAQQIRQFASDPDKAGDRLFALGAGMGNQWEIEFSRLVEEKAQDQQVKDLAKMIRQDHEQANQRLQQAAQALNVQLSNRLPEEKQAKLEIFRAMPADKLEKCYLSMLKVDHAADIVNYQIHQYEIQDQQLKQYVSETLPKLQQHGQHVQQVAQAKGIQGGDITALASGTGSQTGADRTNRPGSDTASRQE
jgi:putative membrane protein